MDRQGHSLALPSKVFCSHLSRWLSVSAHNVLKSHKTKYKIKLEFLTVSKSNILNNKHISLEFAGNIKIACFAEFYEMEKSPNYEIWHENQIIIV